MKIIVSRISLFLVLLAFVSSGTLKAQKIAVRTGVNLGAPKIDFNGVDETTRVGFNVGLTSDFSLPLIGWSLNASLLYSNQGFVLKQDYGNNIGVTYNTTINTIEMPVNVRKEFKLSNFIKSLFVQAGLFSSYTLSGIAKDKDGSHSLGFLNNSDRFSTGASVGCGSSITNNIQVLVNYDYGFSGSKMTLGDQVMTLSNRRTMISVAYMF